MTPLLSATMAFAALMVLLALRMPIAIAMLLVGMGGFMMTVGLPQLMALLKAQMFYQFLNYDLSVIAMFMLMGNFAMRAGFSQSLFRCANAFIGHRRGGIAMATVGACAGFGAICGSSLATAATMAQVALPEFRRHGYSGSLATGTLAAGGTLGILIPPSVILVICAVVLEANIETLFQAAMVPGLIAAAGYLVAIAAYVHFVPDAGPAGSRTAWPERLRSLLQTWPVFLIFVLVVVGIYAGWFTPTQAASIGAILCGVWAFVAGMRWDGLVDAIIKTAVATAMIYLIIFGASVLNSFLGFTRLPAQLSEIITGAALSPMLVLSAMLAIFIALGCIMDSLSMILLLVPIFWPILQGLDFGMPQDDLKTWFAILALMVVEIGMITPPVGLNVFVINAMARDVPMSQTFRGVLPFLGSDLVRIVVLVALPGITLWLPHLLKT